MYKKILLALVVFSVMIFSACTKRENDNKEKKSIVSNNIGSMQSENVFITGESDDIFEETTTAISNKKDSNNKTQAVDKTLSTKASPSPTIETSLELSKKSEDLYKDLKGTTVRVIAFQNPDTLTKIMVKEFQKQYSCTLKMEIYSWADWQVKLLEMVGAGNPPDLAVCFDQHFLKYVTSNIIQPVDNFIDVKAPLWDENILKNYRWKNLIYGVNTKAFDGIVLHYNKNILENSGLDGSSDPYELYKKGEWTFDKFREYTKKLTNTKDGKTSIWGYASWIHEVFLLAAGGKGIEVNSKGDVSITLEKAPEIAGLEMIRALVHDDKSTSITAMNNFNTLFNSQKVAFMAERPGYAVPDDSKSNFEVGMVPLPKLSKNAKHYTPAITQSWSVPKGAKNPKGAMAYIYYGSVFSEANKNTTHQLESRRKLINDKNLEIYEEIIKKNPKNFSFINGAGNWYDKMWPTLYDPIYTNIKTAVAAVAQAKPVLQAEINQMLKK